METICDHCRTQSNYQNTHCVHRQEERYCHAHKRPKPCEYCNQIKLDKQVERKDLFVKVCLTLLANDLIKEKEFEEITAEAQAWTNTIIAASEKFARGEK